MSRARRQRRICSLVVVAVVLLAAGIVAVVGSAPAGAATGPCIATRTFQDATGTHAVSAGGDSCAAAGTEDNHDDNEGTPLVSISHTAPLQYCPSGTSGSGDCIYNVEIDGYTVHGNGDGDRGLGIRCSYDTPFTPGDFLVESGSDNPGAVGFPTSYTCVADDDAGAMAQAYGATIVERTALGQYVTTLAIGNTGTRVAVPSAAFTATPASTTPGQYQFVSSSTDPSGEALNSSWNFGDGTASAIGAAVTHTYTKPGTYVSTLTVTNTDGQSDSTTQTFTVDAPTLSASLQFLSASGSPMAAVTPKVGDIVPVQLTLAASADGVGSVNAITFTGDPVTATPAAAVSLSAPTPAIPAGLTLAAGASTSFVYNASVLSDGIVHLTSTPLGTDDSGQPVTTIDGLASYSSSPLSVVVTALPKQLTLPIDPKTGKATPKPVTIQVTVTNNGSAAVAQVTAPSSLVLSYADPADVSVATISLKAATGPKPQANLGTLQPGQSATATYTLNAEGDGKYNVEADISATSAVGLPVGAVGTGQVSIGAPILVMTTKFGKSVKSPDKPGLIKGGTAFTVDLTLQNQSYVKTIAVKPIWGNLIGNASDGHTDDLNDPIQVVSSTSSPSSQAQVLEPRQTKQLQIVVQTSNTPADVMVDDKQADGGTNAEVTIDDPVAYQLVKATDGGLTLGAQLTGTDEYVDGDTDFKVAIDDTDDVPEPEPSTFLGDEYYFTVGLDKGLYNMTAGAVSGLFQALPVLAEKGLHDVPVALQGYVTEEMELWNSIKNDPNKVSAFLTLVDNQALAAYQNAPALVGDILKFNDAINKQVLAGYTKTWNDYYHGDRTHALEDFGQEFAERAGDFTMAVAPGLLARDAEVIAAFKASKAALYETVTEQLAALSGKVVSATDAAEILQTVLKPGFEMTNTTLRQVFGLTDAEAEFLRQFATDNKYLVVVRSRAAESTEWLAKGAVLKPEAIKIKNVSWLDYKYLGYRQSDIGRVVIRYNLPSVEQVKATLTAAGFGEGDAEWTDALVRLNQRESELTKTGAGYATQLKEVADAKKGMDLKWNFADNAVDPSQFTDSVTNYGFQLVDDGAGNFIPQYKVNGSWRSITGDVDFLQITHANGTPLSDAERVLAYQKLSSSVVGLMHPESATWVESGTGAFDFDAKRNEFVRAGTVAQFAPDGASRAVTFNSDASTFISKSDYRISWDGGYLYTDGKTSYLQAVSATGSASATSAAAGGGVTVSGSGFAAGESVDATVHSTTIALGTLHANAQGQVSATLTLPAGLVPGQHDIELVGASSGHFIDIPITITAAVSKSVPSVDSTLAYTGVSDANRTLEVAGLSLLVGAALAAAGRRRPAASHRSSGRPSGRFRPGPTGPCSTRPRERGAEANVRSVP